MLPSREPKQAERSLENGYIMRAFIILAILSLGPVVFAKPIDISDFQGSSISSYVDYFVGEIDLQEISDLESIAFEQRNSTTFPPKAEPVWTRVQLVNPSEQKARVYLSFKLNFHDIIEPYVLQDDGRIEAIPSEFNKIPISIGPQTTKFIYIKLISWNGMTVTDLDLFLSNSDLDTYWSGRNYAFGIALIIWVTTLLYNIVIYLYFRERQQLYYMGWIISLSLLFTSYYTDFLGQTNTNLVSLYYHLTYAFSFWFSREFLESKNRMPVIDRIFKYAALINLAMYAAISLFPPLLNLSLALNSICGVIIASAGLRSTLRGQKHALPFTLGWGAVMIGAGVSTFALLSSSISVYQAFTITKASVVIENVFMVIAIFQKLFEVFLQREHSYRQLAKVFYPHQLEAMKKGHNLEATMPTHRSTAIVMSFDIIASSKLKHPKIREFLETAVHGCVSILSDNYHQDMLIANGFRIKEMGDGFLASVGYPFACPNNKVPAELAIELSERFIQHLELSLEKFELHQEVYCCIGIAQGNIQGYYPKSGTKTYDVYGRGVILATRYENMRKALFPKPKSHIVILQSEVYSELSELYQAKFQKKVLPAGIRIRDHEDATDLHYWFKPFMENKLPESA